MLTSRYLMQMEDRYRSLREALVTLTDVLLHTRSEEEHLHAFQVAGQMAIAFFRDEEQAMDDTICPASQANKAGHKKFMHDLGDLLHQARSEGSGIPAAIRLRRDLLPWLHEHHRVIDHQLVHHVHKAGRSGETTAMAKLA